MFVCLAFVWELVGSFVDLVLWFEVVVCLCLVWLPIVVFLITCDYVFVFCMVVLLLFVVYFGCCSVVGVFRFVVAVCYIVGVFYGICLWICFVLRGFVFDVGFPGCICCGPFAWGVGCCLLCG